MRSAWFLILVLISQSLFSQDRCGTIAPTTGEFEIWVQQKILQKQLERQQEGTVRPPVYEIPVVVHVLHKGEPLGTGVNLSYERIKGQIDSLNADFRRMNADAINTPTEFLSVAADTEIQFVLARQDPSGNPTNGIVRKKGIRNTYSTGSHRELMRSESYWPPESYMNMFVTDLAASELGRSSFPITNLTGITNDSGDIILDGLFVDYLFFGVNTNTTSFESYGRTLTHEVGHFFGLRHIWGDGDCDKDDFVDDTPLANSSNSGLTSPCTFPNPDDGTVCDTDEMFQNFMDYTDDICMNLFTQGQKERVRTVVENSPRRTSLTTSPGLLEPARFENDLAIVEINSPNAAQCNNIITPIVTISNHGTNEVGEYEIQFLANGKLIQTLTQSDPISPFESEIVIFSPQDTLSIPAEITFNIASVNSTVDGNSGNNSLSTNITSTTYINLPYTEDFEGTNTILGKTGNTEPWEVATAPRSFAGNQALKFKSYQNQEWNGNETILKTPIFDLSGFNSAELSFSYAHSVIPDGFWDGLVVMVSTDCGNSFSSNLLFSEFGTRLSDGKQSSSEFTPSTVSDWNDESINITQFIGIDGVQFAFVGANGGGNNIYLDNISVVQTDLNANDISPITITAPIITCADQSTINLRVRNVGFETIQSFEADYKLNEVSYNQIFDDLNLQSGEFQTFQIPLDNVQENENPFEIELTMVNGVADESSENNSLSAILIRNLESDTYPLKLSFESPDNWQTTAIGDEQLWIRDSINHRLFAAAYDAVGIESQSWFVSPELSTGILDSAGLFFRASYGSRPGFNDQLEVRVSIDCGETYGSPILIANSDSLAITESANKWIPTSDDDWKEFRLDLSNTVLFKDRIRVAFVFTNGNGNDLYIDDISIRGNEEPTYENLFRVFPNPATTSFNIGFNLPKKETVSIQLMDMAGRIIFEETIENTLNQIIPYSNSNLNGIYFVRVSGRNFVSSQKIVINSN